MKIKKYEKIPSAIKCGGQVAKVSFPEYLEGNCGECSVQRGYIEIAQKLDMSNHSEQSDTSKVNTFYHELVHIILDSMGEKELSSNEKFVSCFAGFLTDAMDKAYFEEESDE